MNLRRSSLKTPGLIRRSGDLPYFSSDKRGDSSPRATSENRPKSPHFDRRKAPIFYCAALGNLSALTALVEVIQHENEEAQPIQKIRSKAGMSVTRAANFALVDPRTWRCWETEEDNETARSPKAAALWSFFARSGLPEPVTQMEHSPRGQVLSIASAKGGVGKTPITINVAASMVEKGFKVAIVTHDLVYRFAHDDGQQPVPGTLVSKIDFYDELDLITFTDAVKHRRNDTRQHLASLPPHEQELYRAHHAVELRALERKQHATEKLSELIKGALQVREYSAVTQNRPAGRSQQ